MSTWPIQAADLSFSVPPMAMLGNVPLTGDLILKDSILYYKVSLMGTKYTKMDLGSLGSSLGALSSSLPVAVPTAVASAAGLTDELSQLQAEMTQAGVKATLVGVDQIGGQDANHITISFPLATLNAEIAAAAPSSGPVPTIDSASARRVDLQGQLSAGQGRAQGRLVHARQPRPRHDDHQLRRPGHDQRAGGERDQPRQLVDHARASDGPWA